MNMHEKGNTQVKKSNYHCTSHQGIMCKCDGLFKEVCRRDNKVLVRWGGGGARSTIHIKNAKTHFFKDRARWFSVKLGKLPYLQN